MGVDREKQLKESFDGDGIGVVAQREYAAGISAPAQSIDLFRRVKDSLREEAVPVQSCSIGTGVKGVAVLSRGRRPIRAVRVVSLHISKEA